MIHIIAEKINMINQFGKPKFLFTICIKLYRDSGVPNKYTRYFKNLGCM